MFTDAQIKAAARAIAKDLGETIPHEIDIDTLYSVSVHDCCRVYPYDLAKAALDAVANLET